MDFQSVFYKVRLALAVIALVVIAGILCRSCSCCSCNFPSPEIKPKEENVTRKTVTKDIGGSSIPILDKNKEIINVPYKDASKVKKVISIPSPSDSAGNPVNPTTLLVEEQSTGFFPEIFGRSKIKISSLDKNPDITVLDLEEPLLDFETNLIVGANYSKNGIEPSIGVTLARVSFVHFSTSISGLSLDGIDLDLGAKVELIDKVYIGYDYGIISENHKVSLHYYYKF